MVMCILLTTAIWQQKVSYEITGYLDTEKHLFAANENLIYFNSSPYAIDALYFHLYANAYRDPDTYFALEAYKMGDKRYTKMRAVDRGYIDIKEVQSGGLSLDYMVDETIMCVQLNEPLEPGDSSVLKVAFCVKIPRELPGFGYWIEHYEMTQWYPKICVFDEEGWHLDQLHPLAHTNGEFGTYDVSVELPGDYVIAATGRLVDWMEQRFLDTLAVSRKKLPRGVRKKVHFHAENVHDFAWVCGRNLDLKRYSILSTNVNIFYRLGNEDDAETTYQYAFDAISRYSQWFGEYPYRTLNFVDGFYQGKDTYPQMVITGLNEDQVTRLFETTIVTKTGMQWLSGAISPNTADGAWLGDGLATYAAIRYMEDKYGKDNSLIKIPLLPPMSLRYVHRLVFYIMQTNQLEKPVSTSAYEYFDIPISYQNSIQSKPALFMFSLENLVGKETLNALCQQYYQASIFKHVNSQDFIKTCEAASGQDLTDLFDTFLHTTEYCDWRVNGVRGNTVEIENAGALTIPIDLHVGTELGEQVYAISADTNKHTVVVSDTLGEIKWVALDPSEYTLDPNYWNNYAPRKVSIKPIFDFDWPSFSTYQVLWSPYLWYSSYDGITAGFYLFGDKFADFDFVKGGFQVTAGYRYGFKSGRHYPSLNYQTPVLFKEGRRVRIRFSGSRSRGGDNVNVGIVSNLGRAFTREPQMSIANAVVYNDLSTFSGLDSIDWDLGRNITFENDLKFRHADLLVDIGLSAAHHALGSEWEYLKMTLEAQKIFSFVVPFSTRLFVGKIFGQAPTQERLFLSGALRANFLANLLFGQSGTYSPQERVHIPGDGNMRGYQTLHIKSDQMYVVNFEFPTRTLIRVFTDIGYHDKFAYDVGLRVAIGSETFPFLPLYGLSISLNLPLYSYVPGEPWKFRWSFGFSL